MHVNLNLINFTTNNKTQKYAAKPQSGGGSQIKEYSPLAYRDYNINFGARLFRSPQNFYEQDFNEKNMPKTLHKYIYESYDSEFKRTIPPAQAMKEVFGKINFAKDLDTVKLMFPDEPLFENLSSVPKRKSREGLLGVINMLKDEPDYAGRTLFKNGDNDLGMYILKKIYLEGKTLKEINKDFAQDVSVHFKSYDIKSQDYNAFGIKFPNQSFWKSFTATREDFPYVYIPRNAGERAEVINSAAKMPKIDNPAVKKHREPMTFEQRKHLSEAMVNWHANMTPEEKAEWNKKRIEGLENSIFHNYFGEIVTIAQDKINLSDKMAEYMEKVYGDPNYLSYIDNDIEKKSQVMKRFWKANDMLRKDYSKAMLETITQFDKAYGDDGENYDFLRLLAHARGVKLNNEEGREVRDMLRAEIKAEKEKIEAEKRETERIENERIESEKMQQEKTVKDDNVVDVDEIVNEAVKNNNAKVYTFTISDGTQVSLAVNLEEMMTQKLEGELNSLPKSFVKRYVDFFLNHPKASEEYMLSSLIDINDMADRFNFVADYSKYTEDEVKKLNKRVAEEIKAQMMPSDEIHEISAAIHEDFDKKNQSLVDALDQGLREYITKLSLPDNSKMQSMIEARYQDLVADGRVEDNLSAEDKSVVVSKIYEELVDILASTKSHHLAFMDTVALVSAVNLLKDSKSPDISVIEKLMQNYRKPLTESERRKLSLQLSNDIIRFDTNDSLIFSNSMKAFYKAAAEAMKKYPQLRKNLVEILNNDYLLPRKSHFRYMLKNNPDKILYDSKVESLIRDLLENEMGFFQMAASIDLEIMDKYIKPVDPEIYNKLLVFRFDAARAVFPTIFNKRK